MRFFVKFCSDLRFSSHFSIKLRVFNWKKREMRLKSADVPTKWRSAWKKWLTFRRISPPFPNIFNFVTHFSIFSIKNIYLILRRNPSKWPKVVLNFFHFFFRVSRIFYFFDAFLQKLRIFYWKNREMRRKSGNKSKKWKNMSEKVKKDYFDAFFFTSLTIFTFSMHFSFFSNKNM